MRITGGKARGIHLRAPKGDQTRPASDRNREAIFSSIGQAIEGTVCVDLFAGTGSYGFEALSRGAHCCYFLESNLEAIQCLKGNAQSVAKSADLASQQIHILKENLMLEDRRYGALIASKVDVIFLDPPYAFYNTALTYLLDILCLQFAHENCTLILECPSDLSINSPIWTVQKRIGSSARGKGKGKGKPSVALLNLIPKTVP